MKKCLLATVIMMAATAVYAEPTAMLKVHGTLTSAGCVPEISNGGVADFGEVELDEEASTISVPAADGVATLTEVFRRIDQLDIELVGLSRFSTRVL